MTFSGAEQKECVFIGKTDLFLVPCREEKCGRVCLTNNERVALDGVKHWLSQEGKSSPVIPQVEVRTSTSVERIQKFSANTAVWLFVRDPKKLDGIEREDLAAFCQASASLRKAYHLIQEFLTMVRKREGHRLDAWLEQMSTSNLPELQSFACGIERDKDAVQAGLTWWVNNGQVEGQVTKLKLIKRQMYGKAGFALLRQRVLHAL